VWVEDLKTGLRAWVKDHSSWKRFALVTDVEWIAKAMKAFAWMAPGEVEVYGRAGEAAATEWAAG
jgi:SpoIIAA-like